MANPSKQKGTAAESAVVAVLRASGWPGAERRALHGSTDLGDVTGCPSICVEVKGGDAAKGALTQPALLTRWLAETEAERRNAHADIGILVIQRGGFGPANAGRWWAAVPWRLLHDLHRGYIPPTTGYPDWIAPTFLELQDLLPIIRVAGYGTTPTLEAS